MLKLSFHRIYGLKNHPAAFGRLCVETRRRNHQLQPQRSQPPSGGCVLKLDLLGEGFGEVGPAAFGRLCVETFVLMGTIGGLDDQPPSGGCVLKQLYLLKRFYAQKPAAFGRLCVETNTRPLSQCKTAPAAFGRLCVETL